MNNVGTKGGTGVVQSVPVLVINKRFIMTGCRKENLCNQSMDTFTVLPSALVISQTHGDVLTAPLGIEREQRRRVLVLDVSIRGRLRIIIDPRIPWKGANVPPCNIWWLVWLGDMVYVDVW